MKGATRVGRLCGTGFYYTVNCRECGKKIDISCNKESYPFKRNARGHSALYFCSWHCIRAYDKKHSRKRNSFYLDYLA